MDTAKVKRFATEARNVPMEGVKNRLTSLTFDLRTGLSAVAPREMQGGTIVMGEIVCTNFCISYNLTE